MPYKLSPNKTCSHKAGNIKAGVLLSARTSTEMTNDKVKPVSGQKRKTILKVENTAKKVRASHCTSASLGTDTEKNNYSFAKDVNRSHRGNVASRRKVEDANAMTATPRLSGQ